MIALWLIYYICIYYKIYFKTLSLTRMLRIGPGRVAIDVFLSINVESLILRIEQFALTSNGSDEKINFTLLTI
jgi:hypothetical protein